MPDRLLEAYESVPYDSKPLHLSHVSRLETVARLHCLTPPPADRCRVLELGCASGGNLIPMAAGLPNSRFVGIDLAPSQIAVGQADVDALALDNITLRAMSIADINADFGEFDYIICHGVYSWVPPEVQDAILRVVAENLSSNGVAYISYNVYPGWHLRGVARDLLVHHDDPALPPFERIARARALIDSLLPSLAEPASVYETVLADELRSLQRDGDAYLLHEQLEPFNSPLSFTEFAQRASGKGLRYVADALFDSSARRPRLLDSLPSANPGDVIRAQQDLDFARGATFRRTLLCKDSATPAPSPVAGAVGGLSVATRSVPTAASDEDVQRSGGTAQAFRSHDGVVVTTNNPLIIAALNILWRVAPAALPFTELARRVRERVLVDAPPGVAVDTPDPTEGLDGVMLQCALGGVVELVLHDPPMSIVAPERPLASAVVRRSASQGRSAPNLRHYPVGVSELERFILLHLDGTRTRADLLDVVERAIADGRVTAPGDDASRSGLAMAIDAALDQFAATALLMA